MKIDDVEAAKHFLRYVSYYRFSGYAHPWRTDDAVLKDGEHRFADSLNFTDIVQIYDFDRRLRLLVLDGVERIEVAVRAAFNNALATQSGSHWFTEPNRFRAECDHRKLMERIRFELGLSEGRKDRREAYIQHYLDRYSEPEFPPCWMTVESLSLGNLSKIYEDLTNGFKKRVANEFGLHRTVLESWLHSLTIIRNLSAHHSRIWNRKHTVEPDVRKGHEEHFSRMFTGENTPTNPEKRTYRMLYALNELLLIVSPDNSWANKLEELIDEFPDIPFEQVGMSRNWAGFPDRI